MNTNDWQPDKYLKYKLPCFVQTTGLRPYLEGRKSDEDKRAFEKGVLDGTVRVYPLEHNGKVLYPFNRLFFIGYQ